MRIVLASDRTRKGKNVKRGWRILLVMAAMLPWCASNSAEPMGRLFFTPAQRNTLDAGKQLAKPRQAAPSGPRAATLNGVVTRSDGESTIWVNGTAYHDRSPEGVQVKISPAAPATTSIRIPGKTAATRVKVGQRLDLNSGHVQEAFTRRQAINENVVAPAEIRASLPVIAKKSRAVKDSIRLTGESETSTNSSEGSASDIGKDAPAATR